MLQPPLAPFLSEKTPRQQLLPVIVAVAVDDGALISWLTVKSTLNIDIAFAFSFCRLFIFSVFFFFCFFFFAIYAHTGSAYKTFLIFSFAQLKKCLRSSNNNKRNIQEKQKAF